MSLWLTDESTDITLCYSNTTVIFSARRQMSSFTKTHNILFTKYCSHDSAVWDKILHYLVQVEKCYRYRNRSKMDSTGRSQFHLWWTSAPTSATQTRMVTRMTSTIRTLWEKNLFGFDKKKNLPGSILKVFFLSVWLLRKDDMLNTWNGCLHSAVWHCFDNKSCLLPRCCL